MPTIFDSFTKLIGPYLDELSGGVLKSRCEHCTIGAALDHLNHLVAEAKIHYSARRSVPAEHLRGDAHDISKIIALRHDLARSFLLQGTVCMVAMVKHR